MLNSWTYSFSRLHTVTVTFARYWQEKRRRLLRHTPATPRHFTPTKRPTYLPTCLPIPPHPICRAVSPASPTRRATSRSRQGAAKTTRRLSPPPFGTRARVRRRDRFSRRSRRKARVLSCPVPSRRRRVSWSCLPTDEDEARCAGCAPGLCGGEERSDFLLLLVGWLVGWLDGQGLWRCGGVAGFGGTSRVGGSCC